MEQAELDRGCDSWNWGGGISKVTGNWYPAMNITGGHWRPREGIRALEGGGWGHGRVGFMVMHLNCVLKKEASGKS